MYLAGNFITIDMETGSTYILNLSEEDYLRASQKVKYFLNTLLLIVSNIQEVRKEQQSSNRTNTVQHRERYE